MKIIGLLFGLYLGSIMSVQAQDLFKRRHFYYNGFADGSPLQINDAIYRKRKPHNSHS